MTQPMLQDLLANSGLAHAQLLRAMFDSPEDAIIAKTLDGIVQTWNKGAAEMYGFSSDQRRWSASRFPCCVPPTGKAR